MNNLSKHALMLSMLLMAGCESWWVRDSRPERLPDADVRTYQASYAILTRPTPLDLLEIDFHVITNPESDCHPVVEILPDGQYEAQRFLEDLDQQLRDQDGKPLVMCGNLHNKIIQIRSQTESGEFVVVALTPNQYYRFAANFALIEKYVADTQSLLTYYEEIIREINSTNNSQIDSQSE